ncbi:GIY-YIG nuclease family protein (plasmid) [Cereibacter azotoformans]|uniref:GIY-YIG nuclease family protein n=1 Tax=Cereibacter azotoformans TaxID=43057 RepID=UPI0015E67079|nr:GIY-YIG nuclease family protein [Cereibacter azotoformans]MBO4170781.1 GIY-YIG nuclease family protein [Cereibacter azotoformans]UIJ33287.1 GIY-YIG nuclease family protein [Cereibacter azotoformans]
MVDGISTDLQAFYEALEGQTQPGVAYRVFWKRVRTLEGRLLELEAGIGRKVALTRELLTMAALSCPVEWRHGWGASRLSPLEHEGRVYPTRLAFVHAAGRMADRKMIVARLKRGVSPGAALEPRIDPARGGFVYLIRHLTSGRGYVGASTTTLDLRWDAHCRQARMGSTKRFHLAIREYGEGAFSRDILRDGIRGEALLADIERSLIAQLGTLWPQGFNANRGGATSRGRTRPCFHEGEEFASAEERNKILGERHGVPAYVIANRLRSGLDLRGPSRKRHAEHLGNAVWQRQWLGILRRADRGEFHVHDPWRTALGWLMDIRPGEHEGLELVRLDPTGPFAPGNVAWVTEAEKIERVHGKDTACFDRRYPSIRALAAAFDIGESTLKHRLFVQKMTREEAVTKKKGTTLAKQIVMDGVCYPSLHKAAEAYARRRGTSYEKARYMVRKLAASG